MQPSASTRSSPRRGGNGFEGPRNSIEREVAAIWARALGFHRVGVRDDFFELGGTPRVADRIAARASRRFRRTIPPTLLLEAPTVEQFARIVEGWSPLVVIQNRGARPPLFCLHAGVGTVLFYRDLAVQVGPDRPVYALQPRGLYEESSPHTSAEEMAADYVMQMRRVQPRGPYHLVGFCFGAVVAFEVAQQIREAGDEIGLLAALDGGFDDAPARLDPPWLARQLRDLRRVSVRDRARLLSRKLRRRGEILAGGLSDFASFAVGEQFRRGGLPIPPALRLSYARSNHARIARSYAPRPYPGPLTLFVTRGQFRDPFLGWRRVVTGAIDVIEIPYEPADYRGPFWRALTLSLSRLESGKTGQAPYSYSAPSVFGVGDGLVARAGSEGVGTRG